MISKFFIERPVLANVIAILVLVITGFVIGFRFDSSVFEVVAGFGLLLLFGYAMSWVFALIGLVVSSPEAANGIGFTAIFPLTFISSAFVPTDSMPSGLEWFAEVNPFTILVNAMRSLWLDAPAGNYVWGAVVWSLGIFLLFAPLAVRKYRQATR